MRPIRILELRSVRGTGGGPEKTILRGAELADPDRYAITVCYLRAIRDAVFSIDKMASRLPIDYVEIAERHSFDPAIWVQLQRLIRERQTDIVHAHDYKTNFLAWALSRRHNIVPLSTVHGWIGHTLRYHAIYYPLDKRLLAHFPRVIAVSSQICQTLIAHGASSERVTTILNGIEPEVFKRNPSKCSQLRASLSIPQDRVVIGSVGRLEPEKRFDLLMTAFAQLRASRPSLVLLIAGDGSVRPALEAQARQLGLGNSLQLLGHRMDIADLHHAFDLFVQSSDHEGTPNAVLEAMALQTPVVATSAGGTEELIADGVHGRIVPCGNVDALTQAIAMALADPAASRARATAARRRIESELSFQARTRAVERIYDELMAGRNCVPHTTRVLHA